MGSFGPFRCVPVGLGVIVSIPDRLVHSGGTRVFEFILAHSGGPRGCWVHLGSLRWT